MVDLLLLEGGTAIASVRERFELPFRRLDGVPSVIAGRDFVELLSVVVGSSIVVSDIADAWLSLTRILWFPEDEVAGLLKNISLMLLRRSNSGIRRPDSGRRSFVEYSRCRSPFTNIPGGLTIS